MARARTKESNTTTNTNEGDSNMSEMFTPIDDAETLADILQSSRGRGDYRNVLQAFIGASIRLAQIPLTSGAFEGKKAQTVKTGFENAKNSATNPLEGAKEVKVIKKNDQIYLLNQAVSA